MTKPTVALLTVYYADWIQVCLVLHKLGLLVDVALDWRSRAVLVAFENSRPFSYIEPLIVALERQGTHYSFRRSAVIIIDNLPLAGCYTRAGLLQLNYTCQSARGLRYDWAVRCLDKCGIKGLVIGTPSGTTVIYPSNLAGTDKERSLCYLLSWSGL